MHPLMPRAKHCAGCWPGDLGDGRRGSGSGVVSVVVTGCVKGTLTALLGQAVLRGACCCISAGASTCTRGRRAHKSYAATAEDKVAEDGKVCVQAPRRRDLDCMPRQPGRVPLPAGAANAVTSSPAGGPTCVALSLLLSAPPSHCLAVASARSPAACVASPRCGEHEGGGSL